MRIFHIIAYEKFTEDYIKRINSLFDPSDHLFFVYGDKLYNNIRDVHANNVVFTSDFKNKASCAWFYIKNILKAKKVIIHALFFTKKFFQLLILLQPFSKHKYFWNIWGSDLYNSYWERDKYKKLERSRRLFIKNLRAVGYIKGDYEFLLEHYKTKAKFYLASYSYDFFVPEIKAKESDNETINILLGNSATKECQYIDALDKLAKYKELPIKIKCVLAYPIENKDYINEVVSYGRSVFGDKFLPLTDFMAYEDYMSMLAGIDIAIFNHNRQQALGNIASLLYLGKRVYISTQNACGEYFKDMGAIVFDVDDINDNAICKTQDYAMITHNREIIDNFFSDTSFKKRWEKIFEDKF